MECFIHYPQSATMPSLAMGRNTFTHDHHSFLFQSPTRDVDSTFRVHMGHRISPRMSTDTAEPLLRNSVDPPAAKLQSGTSPGVATAVLAPSPTWTKCQGSSELQCPRCLTTYDDTHAVEYLKHCMECVRL